MKDKAPLTPSELDLEFDPLLRLEQHARSTRQAIAFVIAVPLLTLLTAGVLMVISHANGGPDCDAGLSDWVCSRTFELLIPIVPGAIALGGVIGAAWITYRKWKRFDRWRPWLAICWILIPFFLAWATGTGTMAILGLG